MSIATENPRDALNRAREMAGPDSDVTITDRSGNIYTIAELEANVLSGAFSRPDTSKHIA